MTPVFLGALLIYSVLQRVWRPPDVPVEPTPAKQQIYQVVFAAIDLMPRTLIMPGSVRVEERTGQPPFGVFTSEDQVLHRIAKTLIRAGEPIFKQHVTPPIDQAGVPWLIPPGKLGFVLTIPRREGLPPIRAGDYIKVYGVFLGVQARPLVQRAQVLAVDNRIGEISLEVTPPKVDEEQQPQQPSQPPQPLSIIIAVTPEEAKALALAIDNEASLYCALHPAPAPIFPPPELESPMTIRQLTGSPLIETTIAKQKGVEITPLQPPQAPPTVTPSPQPLPTIPPVVITQLTKSVERLSLQIQALSERMKRLEEKIKPPPPPPTHQVVGVMGEQVITLSVPTDQVERR